MIALLAVAAMLLATLAALAAPLPVALALLAAAILGMRRGRPALLVLAATGVPLHVALVSYAVDGPGWGPFSVEGARYGAEASARLLGALAANLALLSWVPPARILDGLTLPRRAHALLAAVLIAAHDVARDFDRLRTARRLRGEWPSGRMARARAAAALLPALLVHAHERSLARRDALRLAGVDVGRTFVAVVAVAALAAAGRMALLALPNVALTYVVVFLGGLLFGPLAGALGGLLGMALTDFVLTGLYLPGLVNAPAMALLGLAGGALRRIDFAGATRADRAGTAMLAASLGIASTFAFSVAADTLTWALVLRGAPQAWLPLVLAGLAFNVLPALLNGALFAAAVGPTVAAFRARENAAARLPGARGASAPAAPPAPGDSPPDPEPTA